MVFIVMKTISDVPYISKCGGRDPGFIFNIQTGELQLHGGKLIQYCFSSGLILRGPKVKKSNQEYVPYQSTYMESKRPTALIGGGLIFNADGKKTHKNNVGQTWVP